MNSDLVRIHHADYDDDIPFWKRITEGLDPILEIGCGHGRVTLPLLLAGHIMVGVDYDNEALSYLHKTLVDVDDQIRQRITLVQTNILDYQPQTPYSGVILPCNTYSTFRPEEKPKLIRKVHSWLMEEGKFIISLPNPIRTEEIFAAVREEEQSWSPDLEKVITHPETGLPVQVSSRLRNANKSLYWDWIYDHLHPDGGVERVVVTVEQFLFSREELLAELEEGGFQDVLCLGDFGGKEFRDSSPYLILICKK